MSLALKNDKKIHPTKTRIPRIYKQHTYAFKYAHYYQIKLYSENTT